MCIRDSTWCVQKYVLDPFGLQYLQTLEFILVIAALVQMVEIILKTVSYTHLEKVYPTDANFFLAKVTDANAIYDYLVAQGIIVRNRNKVQLCGNCLQMCIRDRDYCRWNPIKTT